MTQTDDAEQFLAIADRLFKAIERSDVDAIAELYAPGARIWHNTDGKVETPEQNLSGLRRFVALSSARTYTEIRREPTPSGFVQQHVLRAQLKNGREFVLPACIICVVNNGRITRLDEYLDSAPLSALRSELPFVSSYVS